MRVVDLEIVSDVPVAQDGFLGIRRLRVRNVREDGTRSADYGYDFLTRPKGQDAVVVVAWCRRHGGVEVLLRDQLRPPLYAGRDDKRLFLREVVAGILEVEDVGPAGIRRRAALELEEEAGFRVAPEALQELGPSMFPSPGAMTERLHFFSAEVDPRQGVKPVGDGSPAEEGSVLHWVPLADGLVDIVDLKTEVALRRLGDTLRS